MAYKRNHCGALILNVWGQAEASNVGYTPLLGATLHSRSPPEILVRFPDFSKTWTWKGQRGAEKKIYIYIYVDGKMRRPLQRTWLTWACVFKPRWAQNN